MKTTPVIPLLLALLLVSGCVQPSRPVSRTPLPAPTAMPATPPPPPTLLPSPSPAPTLAPSVTPAAILNVIVPSLPTPPSLLGGGIVQVGDFAFDLRLFRDPAMSRSPVAPSLYSDLEGIGAHLAWVYQGPGMAGPVSELWGIEPGLSVLNTYPSLATGANGGRQGGILLPPDFFGDFQSKTGKPAQVMLKLETPQGTYGAVLRFTIQGGSGGFEPADIKVEEIKN